MTSRVIDAICGEAWAMLPEKVEHMLAIVEEHERDAEVLASRLTEPMQRGGIMSMANGGVAVIELAGPIFRRANMFSMLSGGTSTQQLAESLRTALDDSAVNALVLAIDSPGGEATAISELAAMISDARGSKPIVAHVDGMGASGAYWIAAAADEIYVNETARVGSIGVVTTAMMPAGQAGDGRRVQIVSSNAPLKRPNMQNADSWAYMQNLVDDLETTFQNHVAEYRGVTIDQVKQNFGRGGLVTVDQALQAGMVDDVAGFDDVVAAIQFNLSASSEVFTMSENAPALTSDAITTVEQLQGAYPALCKAIHDQGFVEGKKSVDDAVAGERKRAGEILALEEAEGKTALAVELAAQGLTVDTAKAILAKAPKPEANERANVTPFERHMAAVPNPQITNDGNSDSDDPDAEMTAWIKETNAL